VRRCIPGLVLGLALLSPIGTRHANAQTAASAEDAREEQSEFRLNLFNSILFAAAFGFLVWKAVPAFFNARSADIQKAIREATGLKIEADFRYSEIDRKMATLGDEVKRMRAEAEIEMGREHERILHDTELETARIQSHVESESEVLRNEGAQKIRRRTAQLAFAQAEQRLRDRIGSLSGSGEFVNDFIHLMEKGKN